MLEHHLNGSQIGAVIEQVTGERVAQNVGRTIMDHVFSELGRDCGLFWSGRLSRASGCALSDGLRSRSIWTWV
jgi:hypothetical protein